MTDDNTKKMKTSEFRKELVKIMPGYNWTIHRPYKFASGGYLKATGIQSSGFNRISTLKVVRRFSLNSGDIEYEVKSAGYGKRACWLHTTTDGTLARALRRLQNHYEHEAANYASHARALQNARKVASDV